MNEQLREDLVWEVEVRGRTMRFATTWGLFSPHGLDDGSRLLLEQLDVMPDWRVVDVGCGYGAIGVTLAGDVRDGEVVMLDSSIVAARYAEKNTKLNGFDGRVRVGVGNGLAEVEMFDGGGLDGGVDLVISNVPGKLGREWYRVFIEDAYKLLRDGGKLEIVCIAGLRKFFLREMESVFGNSKKIKQGARHAVIAAVR